jgi:hypothetical protein
MKVFSITKAFDIKIQNIKKNTNVWHKTKLTINNRKMAKILQWMGVPFRNSLPPKNLNIIILSRDRVTIDGV